MNEGMAQPSSRAMSFQKTKATNTTKTKNTQQFYFNFKRMTKNRSKQASYYYNIFYVYLQ